MTQVDAGEEKSGGSMGSPDVAVVVMLAPSNDASPPRRSWRVLPAEERRQRKLESFKKKRLKHKIEGLETMLIGDQTHVEQ